MTATVTHIPTRVTALAMARQAVYGPAPLTAAEMAACCDVLARGDDRDQMIARNLRKILRPTDVDAFRRADGEEIHGSAPLPIFPEEPPAPHSEPMIRVRSAIYLAVLTAALALIAAHVLPKATAEAARAASPYCDPVKCIMPIERIEG
ncbi:hypothetical protein [Paenirhodobacter populi]|uniref:Uncharacterized protein n=1 Tax=Paenirhodobacter populi TaxID=2306993 RepID=A0A443JE97_9RHOB|nr:hypothetical protein [Sinirhodobacter populi]RWR18824.1 hypothetical protein D2T30_15815 [Sinirhodobacter populi]